MIQAGMEDLREHIKIRSRNSSLVPYIKHPLPVRNPGIVEIVIGPAAEARAEDAIRVSVRGGISREYKNTPLICPLRGVRPRSRAVDRQSPRPGMGTRLQSISTPT